MKNHKRKKYVLDKNAARDALTGKIISCNAEVITVKNARDYLKQQGCIIIEPGQRSIIAQRFYSAVGGIVNG